MRGMRRFDHMPGQAAVLRCLRDPVAYLVGIMGTLVGQYFQCPVFKKFTLRKGLLRRATRTIRAWIRLTPLTR